MPAECDNRRPPAPRAAKTTPVPDRPRLVAVGNALAAIPGVLHGSRGDDQGTGLDVGLQAATSADPDDPFVRRRRSVLQRAMAAPARRFHGSRR